MIEKDKTYTYDELKEIITRAELKSIDDLMKEFDEIGGDKDVMGKMAFQFPVILATGKMAKLLLGDKKNG